MLSHNGWDVNKPGENGYGRWGKISPHPAFCFALSILDKLYNRLHCWWASLCSSSTPASILHSAQAPEIHFSYLVGRLLWLVGCIILVSHKLCNRPAWNIVFLKLPTFSSLEGCFSLYRVPSAHSRVLSIDDPFANNRTVDEISENSLKAARPIKRRERLSSRVGKYSYTTQNVFEQQLYFGR